jgi:hypothetical protein
MAREHENPFLKCKWRIRETVQRGQDEGINSAHKLVIECVDVLIEEDEAVLPALVGGNRRRRTKRIGSVEDKINHCACTLQWKNEKITLLCLFYQEARHCQG